MRHDHFALVRLQESHDVAQSDGFADAAPADDSKRLSGIDVEAHVLQNRPIELLVDIPELNVVDGLAFRHELPVAEEC